MADNKYCNLVGTNRISDEYPKINDGFEAVGADITAIGAISVDGVTAREIIDARNGSTTLGGRIDDVDNRIDQIIVTPAEGITEQEILDARQGHASLGANITMVKDAIFKEKDGSTLSWIYGSANSVTGALTLGGNTRIRTDYIYASKNTSFWNNNIAETKCWYYAYSLVDKTPLVKGALITGTEIILNADCYIAFICTHPDDSAIDSVTSAIRLNLIISTNYIDNLDIDILTLKDNLDTDISTLNSGLSIEKYGSTLSWIYGSANSVTGALTLGGNTRIRTDYIKMIKGTQIVIEGANVFKYVLATYTLENKTFISDQTMVIDIPICLSADCYVVIIALYLDNSIIDITNTTIPSYIKIITLLNRAYVDDSLAILSQEIEIVNSKIITTAQLGGFVEITFLGNKDQVSGYMGDASLVKFPNSENLGIDFSMNYFGNELFAMYQSKGVNRLDYIIISHWHSDHVGGLKYLLDNSLIDISNATVFLPNQASLQYAIDNNLLSGIDGGDFIAPLMQYFVANNCIIIYPSTELEKYSVDGCDIVFANTDHTVYEGVTTNYNNWSLCNYIFNGNMNAWFSGDIGIEAQAQIGGKVYKSNIHKAEHHGWLGNPVLPPNYINNLSPDVVVSLDGPIHDEYIMSANSPLQTWCERNNVSNYRTRVNGEMTINMGTQSWRLVTPASRFIRNDINWTFTDNI